MNAQPDALCRAALPTEFSPAGRYLHPHVLVDTCWQTVLEGQHMIRAWEYSQALRALDRYVADIANTSAKLAQDTTVTYSAGRFIDVGGAGSNFWQLLRHYTTAQIDRLDPALTGDHDVDAHGIAVTRNLPLPLDRFVDRCQGTCTYDAVFCLSVIEHVANPAVFLGQLAQLVAPGGLLVLTFDFGNAEEDAYHFWWMRKWIASPAMVEISCRTLLGALHLRPIDEVDPAFYGPTVYDYSVFSLALVKEPR